MNNAASVIDIVHENLIFAPVDKNYAESRVVTELSERKTANCGCNSMNTVESAGNVTTEDILESLCSATMEEWNTTGKITPRDCNKDRYETTASCESG
ncbi:MAG: hypothetical protein ACLTE2_02815 [Eubacteriales bacterium]